MYKYISSKKSRRKYNNISRQWHYRYFNSLLQIIFWAFQNFIMNRGYFYNQKNHSTETNSQTTQNAIHMHLLSIHIIPNTILGSVVGGWESAEALPQSLEGEMHVVEKQQYKRQKLKFQELLTCPAPRVLGDAGAGRGSRWGGEARLQPGITFL